MKKNFFTMLGSIISVVALLGIVTPTHAALTSSEQVAISSYIQKRSTAFTPTALDKKAQTIQDRIDVALQTTTFNQFTYDILTYINQELNTYRTAPKTMISGPTITVRPQSPVVTTPTTTDIDSAIASEISAFDTSFSTLILAGKQQQIVAEFEITASVEPFELEELTIQSSNTSIQEVISQMHLYTSKGILLSSDRPDSNGVFDFTLPDYTIERGASNIYAVIDTRVVGNLGNTLKENFGFTLRVTGGEAQGVFSSAKYSIPSSQPSRSIQIQSVLVDDIRLLESSNGTRVDNLLVNGENTLAIFKITTADSPNTETTSPTPIDVLLETLTIQVADTTISQSVSSSLRLERLDRNTSDVVGIDEGNGVVTFDFANSNDSRLISNGDSAVYALVGDISLRSNTTESISIRVNNLRNGALQYTSSNEIGTIFTAIDTKNTSLNIGNISDNL